MKLLQSNLETIKEPIPRKPPPINPYLSRSFLPTAKLTLDGANIAPLNSKSHDIESSLPKFPDPNLNSQNEVPDVSLERSTQNDLNQDITKRVSNAFSRYEQHALQFRENRTFSFIQFPTIHEQQILRILPHAAN